MNQQDIESRRRNIYEKQSASITFQDGRCVDGEVICQFDCEYNCSVYLLLRDGTKNAAGLWNTYVVRYDLRRGALVLSDEFEEEEFEMVEEVIRNNLAKGTFIKKPVLALVRRGVRSVLVF